MPLCFARMRYLMQGMRYGGSRVAEVLRAVELVELLHAMPLWFFLQACLIRLRMRHVIRSINGWHQRSKKKSIRSHVPLPLALHTHLIRSHAHPYAPKCTHTHLIRTTYQARAEYMRALLHVIRSVDPPQKS